MLQSKVNTSLGAICLNDYTDQNQMFNDAQLYYKQPAYATYETFVNKYNLPLQPTVTEPVKEQPKKEMKKMAIAKNKRGLFQVILIDPKEKKMLLNTVVISDSVEDVLLEVDAGKVIKDANLSVSDVDKIINILGQVRKTRKNKTGEVEIINEEEDKQ
jgi:hypothetical protein